MGKKPVQKPAQIRFHSIRPLTLIKINEKIKMNRSILLEQKLLTDTSNTLPLTGFT
jgi:hypothetical protein